MKRLIFVVMVAILSSCNSQEEDNNHQTGTVLLDLEDANLICLWSGTACTFEALSEAQYRIESQNPSIVSAIVDGKSFIVKAFDPGEVDLLITDNFGNRTVLSCRSVTFSNYWKESYDLEYLYKNSVNVVAEDHNMAQIIISEIPSYQRAILYQFVEGTNTVIVI